MTDTTVVDECLERLHEALHRGERPALTGFLPAGSPVLPVLLELAHAEIDFRLKQGEPCRVEEYLARYPALGMDPDGVVSLILAEAKFRRRREPTLSRQEYLDRFPEHRAALETRLSIELGSAGQFPQVPGYEILAELGRGGMGVVYKARQLALDRVVALKMVLDGGALSGEEVSRLRIEAEAIARLQHPNIVRLYEVGTHAGCSYLALEYIEGVDLEACCGGRPVPPRLAAELVLTLARAVEHAHRQGILHRDLKPSNVLVPGPARADANTGGLPVAEPGSIRITDFGLARRLTGGAGLTHTGELLGTPGYMAPEQVAGAAAAPGPAVDIYALGALLYALVSGAPPFRGRTPQETLRQQACAEPVPLRRLQPHTPRDLEVICLKCLAREPRQRYASAQDLADDLRRFLAGEPIAARPAGPLERTWKWMRRRPWVAAACAAVVLALATGVGGLFWHNAQLQEAIARAEEQLARRQQQLDESRAAAAKAAAEQAGWSAYVADMRVGVRLLQSGDLHMLPGVLRRHEPSLADPVDRRGFEWWYLARFARQPRPAWRAHNGPVNRLAYAADGQSLVTASSLAPACLFQEVKVWDRATGKALLHRKGPNVNGGGAWCVMAVAPGGRALAFADNGEVQVFAFAGRLITRCATDRYLCGMAFVGDSRHLAIFSGRGIHVWGWGEPPGPLQLHGKIAGGAGHLPPAPLAGTQLIAVGMRSGAVEAWDYGNGRLAWRVPYAQLPTALAPFPRRPWLAIAQGTAPILVCNGHGSVLARLQGGAVLALAISADERILAAAGEDGAVRLWDTTTWKPLTVRRWQSIPVHALAFAPDGSELAVGTADGVVYRLDVSAPQTPELLTVPYHLAGPVVFSPNGKRVAVAATGGHVLLMDATDARICRTLPGDGEAVRALAFAPRDDVLAVVSSDSGAVRLWDTPGGRCLHTLDEPRRSGFRCAAFAPDEPLLVTAGAGHPVVVWDVATGRRVGVWKGGEGTVNALTFAPLGHVLASGSATGELHLWDARTLKGSAGEPAGQCPPRLASCHLGSEIHALAWSPDGRTLAAGTSTGIVRYDVADPATPRQLPGIWEPSVPWRAVQFSADGRILFAANSERATLLDVRTGRSFAYAQTGNVGSALAPCGTRLALLPPNGPLCLGDLPSNRMHFSGAASAGAVRSLALTPDARLLAVGRHPDLLLMSRRQRIDLGAIHGELLHHGHFVAAGGDRLQLWDPARGTLLPSLPAGETLTPPERVAITGDGSCLAAGSDDGSVWIWDLKARRLLQRRFISAAAERYAAMHMLARRVMPGSPEYAEGIRDLAFAPDASLLAILTTRGQVLLWEKATWQERRRFAVDRGEHGWIRFTPDGKTLAVGGGPIVTLWDPATGKVRGTLGGPNAPANLCGDFSPDGRTLVTGGADRQLHLWEVATRQKVREVAGHLDRVNGVAFAPDGRTLASCGGDRAVRLWNVATWQEVACLEGHQAPVYAVAFARDGRCLVTGGATEVLLWRAAGLPP